jgi:hypothetical protein
MNIFPYGINVYPQGTNIYSTLKIFNFKGKYFSFEENIYPQRNKYFLGEINFYPFSKKIICKIEKSAIDGI